MSAYLHASNMNAKLRIPTTTYILFLRLLSTKQARATDLISRLSIDEKVNTLAGHEAPHYCGALTAGGTCICMVWCGISLPPLQSLLHDLPFKKYKSKDISRRLLVLPRIQVHSDPFHINRWFFTDSVHVDGPNPFFRMSAIF